MGAASRRWLLPIFCIHGDAIFYELIPTTGIPVVSIIAKRSGIEEILAAMNSITRLVSGLLSSFLLALGFERAADRFDPTNKGQGSSFNHQSVGIAAPCTVPCEIASETT